MASLGHPLGRVLKGGLGQASPLVLGRLVSVAVTVALPLMLVRFLAPQDYGAYKQFFLVGQTVLLVGQLGLTQSLFYFLPRGGKERGAYLAQALSGLAAIGICAGTGLYLLGPRLGMLLGDGGISTARAPLAIYAAGMLIAAPLEGSLISEQRIAQAALCYVVSDATRASAMILAAVIGGPPALFWAVALVALARVGVVATLILRRALPVARPRAALLRRQLAYALPFAGASLLYVGQRYFTQYAVSARYDAATFALFAVAAFHLPLVDVIYSPLSEVLLVRLGPVLGTPEASVRFRQTVQRLAALLLPAAVGAMVFGPSLLPILFTGRYAGAVPLFLVASCEIPLWILPLDAVLRAAGDTRFLFLFNAARVGLTAALVTLGMARWGLLGALGGGVLAETLGRGALLLRARQHLGARLAELLDPGSLGRTGLAALGAAGPGWLVLHQAGLSPAPGLALAGVSYGLGYLLLRTLLGRRRGLTAPAVG